MKARLLVWWLVATLVLLPARVLAKNPAEDLSHPEQLREFVSKVVDNEIKPNKAHFMYRLRKQTGDGSQTKEMVETVDGTVARLVAINDRPLTPVERKREEARLQKLVANPELQKRRQREQAEEEARTRRMVQAFPDAFLWSFDAVEPGTDGEIVRLKFRPNPAYYPPTRELQVYSGMTGVMGVDDARMRIVSIDGKLLGDVNFGWGILGKLYKGGHFAVEQHAVADGRWEATAVSLDFEGKALLGLKHIHIHEKEAASNFRRVADNLTLAQGVELLNQQPDILAQKR